ncbi:hypothetical protein Tco_0736661 [Tanacetum coccineum]
MKSSLQGKDNTIKKLKVQISQLMETRSEADRTLDFRALDFQITQLTDKITRAKTIEKTTALLAENENLKTQIRGKMKCITMDPMKPKVLAPGVTSSIEASGSKPRSKIKNSRNLPAKSDIKKKVEDHPRNKSCSKHMTGNRSRLRNFVKKFIGTVRYDNDHFGAIMGYGDYVIGDSVISRVYYAKGLGHNLFSVGQFCDSDLEVAFRKH